ncbi:helix-turn-helix domain-containing protein [Chitinophaga sp. sic0106]|uniref:AraC family transcriptional regulator n=1 Tax=Chitinophaga sp. sic0106 TaxID=2854785 RepID=UPI001C43D741|nr:helix-turn-helix domain-containing protein [Chitinophaga sp. sic0106]MBV7530525.1 helix-turn-helix domain-containing protein [Chitinophaga sp. sic0106]
MQAPDIHHKEFAPPASLQDAISCIWYTVRDFGALQTGFEVLPDGYAEIIFHFGDTCDMFYNGRLHPIPSPFIMGLLNQPVHIYAKNKLVVIGIRCYPWTIFDLLGLPTGQYGVQLFDHPVAALQGTLAKLVHAEKLDEAVALLMQYFSDTTAANTTDATLIKAGAAMRAANGTLPVAQVAAAAHATVRTLERKFKQSSGFTVKDVSGLIRFEQVRNHLWLYPDVNIAGLALELGYTDQSHLSREFKRYSHTTPAAFAKRPPDDQRL